MTFEEYLIDKKIDLKAFQDAEPQLYKNWQVEFEQVHPNSFTAQKLYLINPIRRKYILKQVLTKEKREIDMSEDAYTDPAKDLAGVNSIETQPEIKPPVPEAKAVAPGSKPARPVFKPKPKI